MRSGLWLEYATTAGVVPAAGTTLRLLPMESVLTSSWERLSSYNAAAVSPDSHCCGVRETHLAAVITNNPTYRENCHTPRNALPRGRPSPPRNTPSPTKKSTARNTPNPKTHYHHPETPPHHRFITPSSVSSITITTPKTPHHHRFQGRDANYNSSANHLNINDTLLLRT